MHLTYDLQRTWEANCERGPTFPDESVEVAAVGGASTTGDVGDFFEAGAAAVLCGSSPMYVPNLAIDCKRLHPEW